VDGITRKIDGLLESLGNEKSIWEHYNEMAAVDDSIREVEWRDLADTVLVFVCMDTLHDVWLLIWFQDGLFAAFLSAFLVVLIPQLQPNSTDITMDALIHISQQLNNSITPPFVPATFQVSSNVAVVNMLFFLSLALVLIDAFLAMLVKGWLHEFDRGWRKYTVAHLRAQERERRLQELERWKLHEIVALLPILIQGSLLLFCIGLLVLIFPLHLPSAIFGIFAFVSVIGFYGFITYVSIVNYYAPFSSPLSLLLARGLAIAQTYTRRITSAIRFHNRPHPHPQEQQADADISHGITQLLPSNSGVAKPMQPHRPDSVNQSKVAPRSRSDIDPQTHVHVLERLVSTTTEAVENIPIFLGLLDQPVKHVTLQPSNAEKWKELLDITLGLLRGQSSLPVSAAWTLARIMMICYNCKTADRQLCLTLQHHLGTRETDAQSPRMPLNVLFSSYLRFWLDSAYRHDLWRTIAFLEPSDAADAELFWMVNTFHRAVQSELLAHVHYPFLVAVLTYISSTEQSRRSKIPLTAAVIYAMHTIRSALDKGGINSIGGLCILSGTASTSDSMPMMFCPVDGIDALDLWSEDCIQFVKGLLQRDRVLYWHHDFQLSLIAALYIDSTRQAHARSTFADLLKHTRITYIWSQNPDAYDHGKLAAYWYMALSQKPLDQDRDPIATPYDVIENIITEHSTLQLSGLRILEIAVKHVHQTAPCSSDWLQRGPFGLRVIPPDKRDKPSLRGVDHWVLLHLETLLAPQSYLLPEEVKELKWSDTPEKVHIAKTRLDLYAKPEYEGSKGPTPDPELLRVFLWSRDIGVCTQAFKWCVELAPISHPGPTGDGDSTRVFIPETMGCEWVGHFVHVLCKVDDAESWFFLESYLVPKWTTLPPSWCCSFASAFLFSIVYPRGMHGLPAYQCLANAIETGLIDHPTFLPFLETMLQLIESSLTLGRIISLQNWLANMPEGFEDEDARANIEHLLATRQQQLVEEALWFFEELPMVGLWMDLQ
jgi:hypothetical protein